MAGPRPRVHDHHRDAHRRPELTRAFVALLDRAGLPKVRFHDLRHSAATLLLAQGVSARVVMDLLGHSTIGMTLGTYSHVLPQMQRDAADSMDAVLGGSYT